MNNEDRMRALGRVVDELNYLVVSAAAFEVVLLSPNDVEITVRLPKVVDGGAEPKPEILRQYLLPALDRGVVRA